MSEAGPFDQETLNLIKPQDKTRLESGQTLHHHTKAECSGECCLHGSSPYDSCKGWRSWRSDRQILEHRCPCGVAHPCAAGLAEALRRGHNDSGVHGCCGVTGHCGAAFIEVNSELTEDPEDDPQDLAIEFLLERTENVEKDFDNAAKLFDYHDRRLGRLEKFILFLAGFTVIWTVWDIISDSLK